MKKLKTLLPLAALLILFLLPAQIFAGDFAELNFIGFSKDGKFAAFEEHGSFDGSGFPYSKYYFINTEKNTYAAAPVFITIENDGATEAQARSKAKLAAAKTLLKYKIVAGNTGTHVVSHLITDLTHDKTDGNSPEIVRFAESVVSMHQEGDYQLSLKPVSTKTKDCETYGFDVFKLELSLKNAGTNAVNFLQKDAELPKARGCVLSYRVQDVYLYDKFITVFISYQTPGFEGPDLRFMAISGMTNN